MQEMVIYGVSFDMVGKQPIVLLKAVDTNKFLPIWIGHPEAAAILMKLQGASTPRPMTHDLLFEMLGELEVDCTPRLGHRAAREHLLRVDHADGQRPRGRDRLPPERRAGARRPLRRADLRRRGRHRRVRDRVRARGRGHRGGRGQVQGVPRPGLAGGLPRRRAVGRAAGPGRAARDAPSSRIRARPARRSRCPAASAACGSSDVSVRPGIALASSTVELARRLVEHQVDAREAVAAEHAVGGQRELLRARRASSAARSAGQTNVGAADLVAGLEVVEVLVARDGLDDRAAPRARPGPRAPRPRGRGPATWRSSSTFVS